MKIAGPSKGLLVAIEGIPGSGKTTILQAMGRSENVLITPGSAFEGFPCPWKAHYLAMWNPWANLWANPRENCEAYLRWRGEMVRESCELRPLGEGAHIMEGSILPSFMAMAAMKMKWMSEFSVMNHLALEKKLAFHTDHPDYVIVLRTNPEVALKRLHERGLPGDKLVTLDFLQACADELLAFLQYLPRDYASRTFVVENNEGLHGVADVVGEIHGFYPYMRMTRIGDGPPVVMKVPEDPLETPVEGETKERVTDRITRGIHQLRFWCGDCRLPSYLTVPQHSGRKPLPVQKMPEGLPDPE